MNSKSNPLPVTTGASRRSVIALAAAATLTSARLMAADPPARTQPLKIIVATSPGGVPDILARTIGQQITQTTGRPVIVENRLGAAGAIAANTVLGSPADGTVVAMVESGNYSMIPHLGKISPFSELTPVGLTAVAPIYLCVSPQLGVNTVPEFIAYAKANPGMPYGSSGNGSWHHVAMELFKSRAGVDMTHVPYKGAGQTVVALIGGEIKVAFLGYSTAMPQAAAGKLKILAIGSSSRSSLSPDIPTIQQAGGPKSDMRMSALFLFSNPNTPTSEIDFLNRQFALATSAPAVQTKLAQMGIESADGKLSAKQFSTMAKEEYAFYGSILKTLNIRLE